MAAPHAGNAPNPGMIFDTLQAFQRTAALRAAIELNVFAALGDGPADSSTMARRCFTSERGMRILCDYLTVIGFIEKSEGQYRHSPTSAIFLDPRSPACMASIAKFIGEPSMMEPSFHLTEIVRSGHTSLPGEGSVEPDNPVWVEFAHSMAPMMAPMAGPMAEIALRGYSGAVRVLDIAAGHGLFGIAIAKQNPAAEITAVDWAAVLEVAKATRRKPASPPATKRFPAAPSMSTTASPMTSRCLPTSCTISTIPRTSRCCARYAPR